MEFFQLEALVVIAQERSFSRAAEQLAHTQPAISISIKKLEEEIGVVLLDRTRKNVSLTDAGEVLFEYAQKIINLRGEIVTAIEELRQLHRGKVTVGANESTSLYFLPRIILAYRRQYPGVKVEIYRSLSEQLPSKINEHRVDFGLLSFDPQERNLESLPVLKDELVFIVNPTHRLANRRKVTVQELGKESFLAHNVKSPSREKVVQFFREHDTPLNISIELATIETIKQFVKMNLGVAIVPLMCVQEDIQARKLVSVPVQGMNIRRTLRLTYMRDRVLSHAAEAFLELVKEFGSQALTASQSIA